MSKKAKVVIGIISGLAAVIIIGGYLLWDSQTDVVTEYHTPAATDNDFLADDNLVDKQTHFNLTVVDSRPLDGWLINKSDAVVKLDIPMVKPDREPELLKLYPSYQEAVNAACGNILPSVNMIDGKAKQFDDGLYAALDQAYYQGVANILESHISLIKRFCEKADKNSPAAAYLAAGLTLADVKVPVTDKTAQAKYLAEFGGNEVQSKPIGFYTWSETLQKCFRFMRFFQQEFNENKLDIPEALARVLNTDETLKSDYTTMINFYSKLTNPPICRSLLDLIGQPGGARVTHPTVAVFPSSTSRETVLFERLFPEGLPPNVNLMKELVRRIKSGVVNLKPGKTSGWYEYQVYALETLLLPEKGEEKDKLLLTKSYKKRMLEAFKALITKRRETHIRNDSPARACIATPPKEITRVSPQLRLEPCPSYYLRTARAYGFLQNFLQSSVGDDTLKKLQGLKKGGMRQVVLSQELDDMKDLFYGFYLLTCEDIGLKPAFLPGELVEETHCYKLAADWLNNFKNDVDLAQDTRVSVPIYSDDRAIRLWVTLGVRLARLSAGYARAPRICLPDKGGIVEDWTMVESWKLGETNYLIAVDEFAEVELPANTVLNREELRAICDKYQTKEAILKALARGK